MRASVRPLLQYLHGMEIATIPTAQEFLALTAQFRAQEPYLTNVMGSTATGVARGREYDSCHWWVAIDDGAVVGAAIRTVPYNLLVSPMPAAANKAMASTVASVFPELPGMAGPQSQVTAFVDALAASSANVRMSEIVYVLRDFCPQTAEGNARRTTDADEELLTSWITQFLIDAGLPMHAPQAGVKRMLDVGWLWEQDEVPVSMCGYATPVGEPGHVVGRIGPVYTPVEHRRHGYAAAVTSRVVEQLQSECDYIMLYADAANPASNGVYQRLGFVEHARTAQVEFSYA